MRESERRAGKEKQETKTRGNRKGKGEEKKERKEKTQAGGGEEKKRQIKGVKRQQPKPELGQAGALGEELGEQERQAEVQEGHGSHHQGVGSSRLGWPLGGSWLLTLFHQAPSFRTP